MAQPPHDWKCHPDLKVEWENFTIESKRNTLTDDLNSELWINFWRRRGDVGDVPTKANSNLLTTEPLQQQKEFHEPEQYDAELFHTPSLVSEDNESLLTSSQQQQIVGIVSELLDVLDMASDNIPEDLKTDIKVLPQHVVSLIFKELREQLTNQGIYSICRLLCEDSNLNSWLDIRLVFKEIFLPMSLFLPMFCRYVKKVIVLWEKSDFILQCKAPIEEWQILVLTCFLQTDQIDEVIIKTGSALLNLLPVLSLSARGLSANESFATLLLKMIPVLKANSSVQVHNEMMTIIQQSNSFNKQKMINALKS
ncbi:ER membrane protein complex subunit 1 [Frankliniella fusca]|uniref:ER membrane protein complex subunit 1 n=1 Tax=Frankliniella fusca TaxID=407009 RepID=A0AAE1LDJ7_9NEOP|nr:ER membrane protein complex subunit 1 [Frankliniella fusca]